MEAVSIYLTCKDLKEAKKISTELLKDKLVVCANIFPVSSLYWWKGKMETGSEAAVIFKTTRNKVKTAERIIKKWHSYELPSYAVRKIEVSKDVMKWLNNELNN
ncbi:divalent-cation tolerance protein CutA [Candidatus Parcubacteria bacterium]|nr:MAG: divalent-cation tolerance protein CutA [Candidatus Parcubacteria bacterium]